jgi:hypothetical protein
MVAAAKQIERPVGVETITAKMSAEHHAATSALCPDCWIMKSAACWAFDAAVKIARLSALSTLSHEAYVADVFMWSSEPVAAFDEAIVMRWAT